jgi:hypothetical protein
MGKFVLILFVLFVHGLLRAVDGFDCERFKNRIDSLRSLDDIIPYLYRRLRREYTKDAFVCLGQNQTLPLILPTTYIKTFTDARYQNRNFIYGDGYATRYDVRIVPFWNLLQRMYIRNRQWQGKIFEVNPTNSSDVSLLNVMVGERTMRYYADVYTKKGMIDGIETIVLDYRKEPEERPSRLRDEMREIMYRGSHTGIYLGQAFRYEGPYSDIYTNDWDNLTQYSFSLNFVLDFREKYQSEIPSWALDDYIST